MHWKCKGYRQHNIKNYPTIQQQQHYLHYPNQRCYAFICINLLTCILEFPESLWSTMLEFSAVRGI